MQKRTIRAAEEVIVVAFFLAAIATPLAVLLLRGEGTPAWENRRLAELPPRPASLAEAYHLPRLLSEYFKDHFGLRAELIRWQAEARVGWLRSSGSPDIILGKDGWLYYGAEKEIELYTGAEPFTMEEMERWRQSFTSMRDWLKARGVAFVVVFVPEKQAVYPEDMPDSIVRVRPRTREDQLIEYLGAVSDLHVVDLRPVLREAKTGGQIYFRTDTHWNDAGAFAAYQVIARELGREVRRVEPLRASDFEVVEAQEYSGDLAGILGLHNIMFERNPRMRLLRPGARIEGNCGDVGQCVSEKSEAGLPRIVMYRNLTELGRGFSPTQQ